MRRLCLFTGGFAAAAGLYLFLLHGAPGVLLAALAAVCALLFLLRRPILRRAAVCVLGLLAGFAWCRGYEALFLRPFADLSGETAAFSAQALAAPQESSYGQSVSARLTLDGKSCMAVIYFDEADGEILPGSLLSGTAKFTTAQEKHLRGKDYDLSRGVFLTASCRGPLHAEPGRASVWLAPAMLAERLRAAIQSAFPSDTASFVQALLLGDKTGLSYADKNDLAIAGIYHAVAVSGMHVSILLGMILLLCGGNHRLAAALGLPAAVFFIVMTGAPASAVRAGVMQALVLCAPLVRRENDPPTTICAALLVLLMQNPWSLLSVWLQLSFASTAGIVFFAGGLYRSLSENQFLTRLLRPKTVLSSLLRAMLTALCCTISSMVFALPITALQFGTVSLAAPVVNVLALWMLSIVFCGGMLTALLALALPAAAGVCAWALSWPVRLVLLLVRSAAKLPFAALYLENGYLIAAAVFLYGLALLLLLNTVGGDIEAGLAIAELIAGMKKPTVSLVLGGGHSIGIPLAVSAKKSLIVPTASMTVHPVRMTGLVVGAPQTYQYFNQIQEQIVNFVTKNSHISREDFLRYMMATDEIATDVGTVLYGEEAVSSGLMDAIGSLSDALSLLHRQIERRRKREKSHNQ